MKGSLSTRQDPEGGCVNTADKTRDEGWEEPGPSATTQKDYI